MASVVARIKKAVAKKKDNAGVSQMLTRYWNTAYAARLEIDWKWFEYDLYYRGLRNVRWDRRTLQVVEDPASKQRVKVSINKVYSTLRGVRSYVLQNKPKAEVTPFNMTEADVDQAVMLNRLTDYLHEHLHLRTSLRASMLHALKYSVGFWQVMWDENAENGQGGIVVNVVDPYDLYIDPVARLPKEARYMILAVRRSIDELKKDPKYKDFDWEEISGNDVLAASTLKARIMMYERGGFTTFNDGQKEQGTVILKEFWYQEMVDSEEERDDPENEGKKITVKTKKPRIMIAAMVNDKIVREPEETGLDRLPFFRLSSDIEPLSMYGQGWCKNLVPLNKALETNESSIMEYNIIVNKGRFSIAKNAGLTPVTNQNGIFVEHKMGEQFRPVPMEVPQLSQVVETQTMRINQYIEDMGCQHDASRGQASSNAVSGVAIEALQEGDSNNLSELKENTEEFLEDVYEYMLFLLSGKLSVAKNVITSTETGEKQFFKVIGEQAIQQANPQAGDMQGVIKIPQVNSVDVKISSYLAYSAEGRRQAIQQLASLPQMANLPPQFILQAYQISPIADIIQQMLQYQQQQAQIQQQQQNQQMQAQGQQQMQQASQQAQIQQQQQAAQAQQSKPADPGVQQAIGFIKELIQALDNGAAAPQLPKQITPLFVQYLAHFVQDPQMAQQNPDLIKALEIYLGRAQLQLRTEGGATKQ